MIIPVRADPRLERCLAALAEQSLDRDGYEVMVVDNGPDERMGRLAERFGARYVVHPEGGSYAARMRGVSAASGNLLVFTDADCAPPPGWLATIVRLFDDPACLVACGPSFSLGSSTVASWVQWVDESRWRRLLRLDRVAYCDTRNLALRREVIERVPFDTAFRQAGDIELGLRLYAEGVAIRLEPAMLTGHEHPASLRAVLRRSVRRGHGLARLERKHGAVTAPIGQRPLQIGGHDVKRDVLRWGSRLRLPALGVLWAATASVMAALWLLARLPRGEPRGRRLFVVFDRLGLLTGRLLDDGRDSTR